MDKSRIEQAAAALAGAHRGRGRLAGLPDHLRPRSPAEAYAIQDALIDALERPVAGWKIGATSKAARSMLSYPEPCSGRVLTPLLLESPARLAARNLFMRGLEVEIAFRLARDLPSTDAPFDENSVDQAVAQAHPAVEIIDSRFEDWLAVAGVDLIADNGCHGALVIGPAIDRWRDIDLGAVKTALWHNGKQVAAGVGSNALGHPLRALAWLANDRARRGNGLRAGEIVTTGLTCDGLGWAQAGDVAEARFDRLGSVEVTFANSEGDA